MYLSGFYLFLKIPSFFKIPLMASLNILCSDPNNFLKEITKKIRKVPKKYFCGSSKILKNISWPINISLKHFMAPAKTLRPPLPTVPNYIHINITI